MRKVAIFENNKVVNVIAVSSDEQGDKEISLRKGVDITDLNVGIGWSFDGKVWTPSEEILEIQRLEQEKEAEKNQAIEKLKSLGLTETEIESIIN